MLAVIALISLVSAFLAVASYLLARLLFLRRLERIGEIEPLYGPYDMPPAVLAEIRDHDDLRFEFGTQGKDWRLEFKCRGRMRLFFWVHAWYMAEFAWHRLPEERRFPFVWWHAVCLTLLSCLAAVKILIWPSPDDVAALVGFDSITAEKLTGIKAALKRRDEAHD